MLRQSVGSTAWFFDENLAFFPQYFFSSKKTVSNKSQFNSSSYSDKCMQCPRSQCLQPTNKQKFFTALVIVQPSRYLGPMPESYQFGRKLRRVQLWCFNIIGLKTTLILSKNRQYFQTIHEEPFLAIIKVRHQHVMDDSR